MGKIDIDCHPVSVAENIESDYEFFKDKTGEICICPPSAGIVYGAVENLSAHNRLFDKSVT